MTFPMTFEGSFDLPVRGDPELYRAKIQRALVAATQIGCSDPVLESGECFRVPGLQSRIRFMTNFYVWIWFAGEVRVRAADKSVNVSYQLRENIVFWMFTGVVCIWTMFVIYGGIKTGSLLLIWGAVPLMALVWLLLVGIRYLLTSLGIKHDLKLVARQALQ